MVYEWTRFLHNIFKLMTKQRLLNPKFIDRMGLFNFKYQRHLDKIGSFLEDYTLKNTSNPESVEIIAACYFWERMEFIVYVDFCHVAYSLEEAAKLYGYD